MITVGYDLYCKLLDQTVKELKGLPVEKKVETQLEFKVDAYIPIPISETKSKKLKYTGALPP